MIDFKAKIPNWNADASIINEATHRNTHASIINEATHDSNVVIPSMRYFGSNISGCMSHYTELFDNGDLTRRGYEGHMRICWRDYGMSLLLGRDFYPSSAGVP